jgi:hypothetical protein
LVFKFFAIASPVFSAQRIDIEAAQALEVCYAAVGIRARGGLFVLMRCLLIRVIY